MAANHAPSHVKATKAHASLSPALAASGESLGRSIDPVAFAPVPTPAPTPTPAARPRVAVEALPSAPPGSIEAIILDAAARHGVSGSWMLKIARCESGVNPRAYNPAGPYYGLFQFLMSTFRANGGTDIWDPYQQAEITATMLSHGQAHQWGCA